MDLQYGIAVTNKYALFIDEDEDPLEILRQKEEEAKNQKKDDKKTTKSKQSKKTAVAAEAKPKQIEQPAAKKDEKVSQPRQNERGGGRGGRGRELRENDGSRPPRRQSARDNRDFKGDENVPPEFRDRGEGGVRRDRGDRERGEGGFERGRGRGGGRGRGRGGRGGPRPDSARGGFGASGERRRDFDRHSGTDRTGVKPVDKREGSGAHNWGSYRDEIEDQSQPATNPADESGEWATQPVENAENADLNESGESGQAKEEEAKEMTLDEWKALEEQRRVKASFNIRKAGEGVDNTQWKKGTAYKKKHEEGSEEEESEEEEEEEDRHGHKKQIVTDIRITFADQPRRGGRGGRRGGRAPGGRGGPRGGGRGFGGGDRDGDRPNRGRGGGPREVAPRFDDETDFPSLVKSEA
ncbi:hypothetical protein BaRGS_00023398 [Batillaria attramentaria]|uniref:Hyaluronan/mRNA-binding protein domain-containing protein n=1 Tax=Batillaria attramentaria TaxID=370345 RepID=A0ABD0KDR8_9CAEN